MNLAEAQTLSNLRTSHSVVKPKVKTAVQVAKRVFQLAANGGFPYKKITAEHWAKKWLVSPEFVLMEVDINAAAAPHNPKNPDRVVHYMHCRAQDLDPVVIDLNKRKVGKTLLGYVPEVIYLDGKHRRQSLLAQGHSRIIAWVGCKAAKKISPRQIINAAALEERLLPKVESTKMASAYEIFATTTPAGAAVIRQDTGEGGSRPKDFLHSEKKKKVKGKADKADKDLCGCGARSSGSLVDDSSNDDKKIPPDSSDADTFVEPSDQLKWDGGKANLQAPGTEPGYTDQFGSPNFQAPGAGSGPRVRNTGASNSEFSRSGSIRAKGKMDAEGKHIPRIWNKKKKMKAVAPPGVSEDTMHDMKRKLGTKKAFKIAWSQHNKGKR